MEKLKFQQVLLHPALVLLICIIACTQERQTNALASGTPVQVTHPRVQVLTEFVDLNANTIFLEKEIVRATFQGFVEKIYKNIGDETKDGDLIFTIKTKESAADDSLRLSLGAQMFQGSIPIRAHSDGVLTSLSYHTGDFVSEGEEIAIISNPASLRITLNVPYQLSAKISRKSICQIFLPDGRTLPAVIQRIIPSVDAIAQTQTFLLCPQQKIALPENLNIDARLPLSTIKDAVALPRSAVMSDETQENFWVMRLVNDSTAVHEQVQTGIENDSLIQILSPAFRPTDQIISDGAFGLPDTAKVILSR